MSDNDLLASLKELCSHKESILSLYEAKIKENEHFCWKYKSMSGASYYDKLAETKKIYNILKYLLETCNGRTRE